MHRKLIIITGLPLVFVLWVVFLFLSCTSLPEWAASPAGIRTVYPDGAFLAQEGRGKTRQDAELDGAAQIARFFNSQISTSISSREWYVEQNATVQSSVELETIAFVESQMNLFGIRYVQDAYYDKAQGEWRTVAYIDRAEAWAVYGPGFRRQAGAFQKFFDAAESENDPFKKAMRYMAAQNYASSAAFENAGVFGQLLHPVKMNAEFAVVRSALASLPQKLDNVKRSAAVFIDCPNDFESLIYNAFSQSFTALGFSVVKTRNTAAALCIITIDSGEQKRDLGVFYYPSLQAVISGRSGALWTFNAAGERSAAVTPDMAKRRAWTTLAEQVKQSFRVEFTANTLVN